MAGQDPQEISLVEAVMGELNAILVHRYQPGNREIAVQMEAKD